MSEEEAVNYLKEVAKELKAGNARLHDRIDLMIQEQARQGERLSSLRERHTETGDKLEKIEHRIDKVETEVTDNKVNIAKSAGAGGVGGALVAAAAWLVQLFAKGAS